MGEKFKRCECTIYFRNIPSFIEMVKCAVTGKIKRLSIDDGSDESSVV